jgi:phosphatidylglycerophosphate synthase
MIDNPFRRVLARYAGPLVRLYESAGLSPNMVTLAGCLLAVASALSIVWDWRLAALALWWLGRLLDGTDGIYARATGRASDFGAYLDILLDMTAYGVMILAFDHVHPELHGRWLAIAFLYILCITSALALGTHEKTRQIAPRDNRGLRLGEGLAEGGETGLAYSLFLLFPAHLDWLTWIWIAVLTTTVIARTELARRSLSS